MQNNSKNLWKDFDEIFRKYLQWNKEHNFGGDQDYSLDPGIFYHQIVISLYTRNNTIKIQIKCTTEKINSTVTETKPICYGAAKETKRKLYVGYKEQTCSEEFI